MSSSHVSYIPCKCLTFCDRLLRAGGRPLVVVRAVWGAGHGQLVAHLERLADRPHNPHRLALKQVTPQVNKMFHRRKDIFN